MNGVDIYGCKIDCDRLYRVRSSHCRNGSYSYLHDGTSEALIRPWTLSVDTPQLTTETIIN